MNSRSVVHSAHVAFAALAVITLTAGNALAQGVDIPAIVTSGRGPDSWVSVNYAHQFAADVDNAGTDSSQKQNGEMSREALMAVAGHRFQLNDDVFLVTQGTYIMNNYHFTRDAGAYRWNDIHNLTLVGIVGWKIDDKWSLLGGGLFRTATEGGGDFGEGVTGGGVVGFEYTWSDTLQTGLILGVMSRIEDSAGLLPLPTVHWEFTDDWEFNFGIVAMAHPGMGPEIKWRVSDQLDLALAGSYQVRRYRLKNGNAATLGGRNSSKGVGEETSFPIFVRARYKPTDMTGIDVFAGIAPGGKLRVEDKDGHKIKTDSYAVAKFLGVRFSYMF